MKKNLEYFQHDTDSYNHPKFKMLRLKYSWAGEGKFWALNSMIGLADNCKLNLNKDYNRSMIAYDLGFTLEEFDEYLTYLCDVCKLIKYRAGVITTDRIQENYKKVHGDRVKARERKTRGVEKFTRTNTELLKSSHELTESSPEQNKKQNKSKSNQTKQNKIKLNKTKQKKTKQISDGLILDKKDLNQELKPSLNGKTDFCFNKFWKFYNRREGDLMKVRETFIKNIRSENDFNDLIKATRNYNNLTADRELKYMKMPINFLETYKDFIKIDN